MRKLVRVEKENGTWEKERKEGKKRKFNFL